MVNWESARSMGANFYQVFIEGPVGPPLQVTQSFGDYLWSVPLNAFELVTTTPTGGGYYPLRSAGQIWLNFWLGPPGHHRPAKRTQPDQHQTVLR